MEICENDPNWMYSYTLAQQSVLIYHKNTIRDII